MRLPLLAGLVLLAAAPLPAAAQNPPADPPAGSPSEAVYGLQLDRARRDAAPGARTGPALRDPEGGIGSSPVVPGTPKERDGQMGGPPPEGGERSLALTLALLVLLIVLGVAGGTVLVRATPQDYRAR